MIITNHEKQKQYLDKTLSAKQSLVYRIRADGLLEYDWKYASDYFLAYIDGKWYGAHRGITSASEGALEEIQKFKFLFSVTEDRYWQKLDSGDVEYASPSKPLSEDIVSFLVVKQKKKLCVFYIDGSKYRAPLFFGVHSEYSSDEICIRSVIALTAQHDPEAAKQMEDFWYPKDAYSVEALLKDTPKENITIGDPGPYITKEDFEADLPW